MANQDPERYMDSSAQKIILQAFEAYAKGQNLRPVHMLMSLLDSDDDKVQEILNHVGNIEALKAELSAYSDETQTEKVAKPAIGLEGFEAIKRSLQDSIKFRVRRPSAIHLFLGILRQGDKDLITISERHGLTYSKVFSIIAKEPLEADAGTDVSDVTVVSTHVVAPKRERTQQRPARRQNPNSVLEKLATNMTALAANGEFDKVIGRDDELERVIHILSRRTKNNPILLGEPGVGKTAVVEGLAQRIVEGEVPAGLMDKQIYSLDLGTLVAGTRYRGDFEERMKHILDEASNRPDVILFVDEIHALRGAGNGEGGLDAANTMKPHLARGKVQLIGATTREEYRKHFEKDAALARRFQPLTVAEPTAEMAVEILKALAPVYAKHHDVVIEDEAIVEAVSMSIRYIHDRHLPDKAIDLLDEASAKVKLTRNKKNVTKADIAEVISRAANIPVGRVDSSEGRRLLVMERELKKRIVGQEKALSTLSQAIRRQRTGLNSPNRPVGSFIFAGPTGVGKTEVAKTLAEYLFGSEDALITLDMSEYSSEHTAARLFGAPPGYVGFEDGGQLTEKVKAKPFSVVLFDEIEKAHPSLFDPLLQILEEGRLTDGQGREIIFRNTVIIMTTNLGVSETRGNNIGFQTGGDADEYRVMQEKVMRALKEHLRPEFLNRIDEKVVFPHLNVTQIEEIANRMVGALNERLSVNDNNLVVTDAARKLMLEKGYNKVDGARPMRRLIENEIGTIISETLLFHETGTNMALVIDAENGEFTVNGYTRDKLQQEIENIELESISG